MVSRTTKQRLGKGDLGMERESGHNEATSISAKIQKPKAFAQLERGQERSLKVPRSHMEIMAKRIGHLWTLDIFSMLLSK